MRRTATVLLAGLLAAAGLPAESAPAVERKQVGARITENVPEIPADLVERLERYQNTRGASFVGWTRDGGMLVATRFGETSQIHRVAAPLGMREQLTFYREPVQGAAVAPASGPDVFVFGKDVGGSEFWQLMAYDLGTRETTLLTDGGRSRNAGALWSRDGRQLAWSSTARNGTDSDVWVRDMRTGDARPVVTEGGSWRASGFSPDGRRLLVSRYVSINDSRPGEVDLETGRLRMFPVAGGTASIAGMTYAPDGRGVYYVSDEDVDGRTSEFRQLRFHDTASGRMEILSAHVPWDVQDFRIAADGRHLAYVANEDGIGRLRVLALPEHREIPVPALPLGVVGLGDFSPDGSRLALTLNTPTAPSDVHVLDLAAGSLVAWTRSEVGGLDTDRFVTPELVRYPTFDSVDGAPRTIPAFYYRPAEVPAGTRLPVVVNIHGGPEAQALPTFNPSIQHLVNELGIAVLVPNVRGSAGYGKTYLQLDNGMLREDSVRDIGALLDWIATRPELDPERVGVYGGSYGGYMVLASMIHFGDRLRAGVDIVGISDFVTFLTNTESYRRDLRRAEYGDERDPEMRAFLERISPLANAARIRSPLFVAQGANDPRVPASEAEQIVERVRGNGGEVWYLLFEDEGHGFRKKTNADYFNAATVLFWQRHLLDGDV
ncbi:S9 family peptidase [Coralloluteibacterium thermophilus]|uniref:S9 family peptidase n=1 Tax=Coralloluteibacterium thermophilum TaxID=2707049 RepID=A0ABV9NMP0_9GAMM